MTAPAVTAPSGAERRQLGSVAQAASDTSAVAWRNLVAYRRVPQLLVFSTIQPVVFVLMFRYVFGGAIQISGESYVNYLMPGIFAQTVVFGSMGTAVGLATDLNAGLIERFRSLPMARSAVLAGRTLADLVRNLFVVVLMLAVGFAVGFRPHDSTVLTVMGGVLLVVLFGYATSWIFACVGLAARDAETAQAMSFPVVAPLVFASTAFVPLRSMPGWLQPFAEHQPVSATVDAARVLMTGGATTRPLMKAVAWIVGMVVVFAPLAVRRYRKVA